MRPGDYKEFNRRMVCERCLHSFYGAASFYRPTLLLCSKGDKISHFSFGTKINGEDMQELINENEEFVSTRLVDGAGTCSSWEPE